MGKLERIDYIVIHCSATREDRDYSFEQLKKDHILRKFKTVGYHYYITKDGTRHIGRPLTDIGAHVGDLNHNWHSVGICYEGGLDRKGKPKDTRTEAQEPVLLTTILEVLSYIKNVLKQDYKKVKILGHRDLSPDKDNDGVVEPHEWVKHCPCFDAKEYYADVINLFKAISTNAPI